jgi:DNA-binding LytR/AlgR family response regulator
MISCLIVDDEPLAQEVIARYVNANAALKLAGVCDHALEAFGYLHNHQIDLMFLDINMPGINGLDFLRSLKDPPAVIFTTAFTEHAIDGFELEAVDYLLKPVTVERFDKAINKMMKISQPDLVREKEYTYFKVSGKLVKINHCEILYVRAVKDYISLCTKNGSYLSHMTMKFIIELLPQRLFVRVHRSFIVNRSAVNVVDKNHIKIGEEMIPVGENYRHIHWNK